MTHDESIDDDFVVVNDYEYLSGLFQVAEDSVSDNLDFFTESREKHSHKLTNTFQLILNMIKPLQISLNVLTENCSYFDVNPRCRGNGYRSIVNIVESCLNKIIQKSEQILRNRDKMFFNSTQTNTKLKSYACVLTRLLTIVQFAVILLDNSDVGCLFPAETPKVNAVIEGLLDDFTKIDRTCFYGSCFGFQYVNSVRHALRVVGVAMAAYGDGYGRHSDTLSRAVSSLIYSGKYIMDPDLRAKRIAELTQDVNIPFCKAFWSLTDEYGVQYAPLLVCPALGVNLLFTIPPEKLTTKTLENDVIEIQVPLLNEQPIGVKARLLSFNKMEGQISNVLKNNEPFDENNSNVSKRSKYLMIHCHGGGFVAQSSKSHEIYLRQWAKELKFPILSIDYSLAPDACFPQALNEVFFAYVWALNNSEKLGTSAEKIVFTGDSAGANLVTALTLKCIMGNIRLPDSLVVAYPPYRAQYYPSPSRILCLMDPLLPIGVLKACLQAYAGELREEQVTKDDSDYPDYPSCMSSDIQGNIPGGGVIRSLSDENLFAEKQHSLPVHKCSNEEEYFSDSSVYSTTSSPIHSSRGCENFVKSKMVASSCGDTPDGNRRTTNDENENILVSQGASRVQPTSHENPVNKNIETDSSDFRNFSDFRNPLMSPIFASDELLIKMPPVSIFACSLDPLFDDSIEFIRRLQKLGKEAKLQVLDRLPHGFLNFQVFSPEAHEACKQMITSIKESLGIV